MPALSRAFVAVFPPPAVASAIGTLVDQLRGGRRASGPGGRGDGGRVRDRARGGDGLRWTRPDQWHLTLRFLGRVADADALAARLGDVVEGRTVVDPVRLRGGGAFPAPRRGSVLWLGVEPGAGRDRLCDLAGVIEDACVGVGAAPEVRPFHPHCTLARAPRPRDLRAFVEAIGSAPVGEAWTIDEVALVTSDTRPDGAVYDVVTRFPLHPPP